MIRGTAIRDTIIRDAATAGALAPTGAVQGELDVTETQVRGTTTITSTSGSRDPVSPATSEPRSAADDAADDNVQSTQPVRLRIRIALDREVEFDLTSTMLVGRNPQRPRVVSELLQLIAVESATGEISATHASVAPSGRLAVVTDLHSTNGTIVRVPGAAPQRLRGGDTLVIAAGGIIELGDGISIAVLPPASETDESGR